MKLEHYPPRKLKQQLLKIIGSRLNLSIYKLFFFGSRVKGDNFKRSDIDVGIEGREKISAEVKLQIKEELEKLPILYKIDLVDFKDVSPRFKKEAYKWIEPLN